MSLLPDLLTGFGNLLKRPGDKLEAKVTPTGRQVLKIATNQVKKSAVRYPKTGTIVETIVHKSKK